jgi:hypothetical protein
MNNETITAFIAERDAALLSLDEVAIVAFNMKWGIKTPSDPRVFWAGIHIARTACRSLPIEARRLSKRWLEAAGLQSRDNGELSAA